MVVTRKITFSSGPPEPAKDPPNAVQWNRQESGIIECENGKGFIIG
jgi:hypothetical protein